VTCQWFELCDHVIKLQDLKLRRRLMLRYTVFLRLFLFSFLNFLFGKLAFIMSVPRQLTRALPSAHVKRHLHKPEPNGFTYDV